MRIASLISGLLGLGFVGISIALFVQYGRLKKLAGTNASIATTAQQVMYLAVALLILGAILTVLGFATVSSGPNAKSDDAEGPKSEADDARDYSLDAFPNFEDRMLAQQLHNLDGRSALIESQKSKLRSRLNAARPVIAVPDIARE